jgi:hypothetical protein
MSDAEIHRIHRRERALWRRYMSRCARAPGVTVRPMTDRDRAHVLRALQSAATARREWMEAHTALEAARLQRALRWCAEAHGIEAQSAAC